VLIVFMPRRLRVLYDPTSFSSITDQDPIEDCRVPFIPFDYLSRDRQMMKDTTQWRLSVGSSMTWLSRRVRGHSVCAPPPKED